MDEGEDWEIDEQELGPEYEGFTQGVPVPCLRATFSRRRLTVAHHRNDLFDDGSVGGMNFADRTEAGISVLELGETECEGFGWELTVGFLADGNREAAERALCTWAGRMGYRRMWLPDRIVEPPPPPRTHSVALVDCPTCGHRWHGRGRRFWRRVWGIRLFPNICPLCASHMPQWRIARPGDRTRAPRRGQRGHLVPGRAGGIES